MSSTDDSSLPTTINSLATELIIKIVRLSSPAPSWDNSVERSAHLRNLALVCRALRGPAQDELFRHVVLPSITASRRFVAVLRSRNGARFASIPRSLRAGTRANERVDQDRFALSFIAKRCSRLESMWLLRINSLDVAAVASGTGLKELFCSDCSFGTALYDRRPDALLLTRLGIRGCLGSDRLDPRLFINLNSLDISLSGTFNQDDVNSFANSLGQQLSSLCVGDATADNYTHTEVEPRHLQNILCLDSRLEFTDLPRFLSPLPSHLRHLRAQPPRTPPTGPYGHYKWASKFIETALERSKYSSLEGLDHVRFGTDDFGSALATERAMQLEDELRILRPEVRLSFDDPKHWSSLVKGESLDGMFNPAFWAFVDDA